MRKKLAVLALVVVGACLPQPYDENDMVIENQNGQPMDLRYFTISLPDGRVLECVGSDIGFQSGLLDCNWNPQEQRGNG